MQDRRNLNKKFSIMIQDKSKYRQRKSEHNISRYTEMDQREFNLYNVI